CGQGSVYIQRERRTLPHDSRVVPQAIIHWRGGLDRVVVCVVTILVEFDEQRVVREQPDAEKVSVAAIDAVPQQSDGIPKGLYLRCVEPKIHGEIVGSKTANRSWKCDIALVRRVEAEGLAHFTGSKTRSVVQGAVDVALGVQGVPFGTPPVHEP